MTLDEFKEMRGMVDRSVDNPIGESRRGRPPKQSEPEPEPIKQSEPQKQPEPEPKGSE